MTNTQVSDQRSHTICQNSASLLTALRIASVTDGVITVEMLSLSGAYGTTERVRFWNVVNFERNDVREPGGCSNPVGGGPTDVGCGPGGGVRDGVGIDGEDTGATVGDADSNVSVRTPRGSLVSWRRPSKLRKALRCFTSSHFSLPRDAHELSGSTNRPLSHQSLRFQPRLLQSKS